MTESVKMFSENDLKKLASLRNVHDENVSVLKALSDFFNNNPCLINEELMSDFVGGGIRAEEISYASLLSGFCGFDVQLQNSLFQKYFLSAVKLLLPSDYSSNLYLQSIKFPEYDSGNWRFSSKSFSAYEAFVRDDIVFAPDFAEIPQIGFFNREFRFPVLYENNREWMSLSPNEIQTMKFAIDLVSGKVVTFGLGLGYFAFMASCKNDVKELVVVESDVELIELFSSLLLPQFPCKEKVKIVAADAFDYIENVLPSLNADYAFVDLWHDSSDGLPAYCKVKKKECLSPGTEFLYWVENSLLSALRFQMYDLILANATNYAEIEKGLSVDFLRKWASCNVW